MLSARIAIDAAPLGCDHFTAVDYGATQVFGLAALPLFGADGAARPLGAAGVSCDAERRRYRIAVGDHRFADGTRVQAHDYRRALGHLVTSARNPVRAFLRDIIGFFAARRGDAFAGVTVSGNELSIELERPNALLPLVLSHPAFSPLHPNAPRCAAGSYTLPARPHGALRLARNRHRRPPAGDGAPAGDVEFVLVPDGREGIRLYDERRLTASCDTLFPYELVARYRGRGDFQELPSRIVALLRVCRAGRAPLRDAAARASVLGVIDRAALSATVAGLATPVSTFAEVLASDAPAPTRPSTAMPPRTAAALTLGYHDFPPNPVLVRAVAAQLTRAGVAVHPVAVAYGAPAETDLLLELTYPLFDDPLSFYLHEAFRRPFAAERDAWRAYLSQLDGYQAAPSLVERRPAGVALEEALATAAWVAPLLRMPRMRICAPGFDDAGLQPGAFPRFAAPARVGAARR